jgi:hypothetical protein
MMVAASIALSACSSSSGSSSTAGGTSSSGQPASSSSTSSASPSTSTPPSSSSSSSSTTASSRCRSSRLSATVGHPNGAAGSVGYVVVLQNTSTSTCTLYGYPGMQLLDASGAALPTHVARGTAATVPPVAEHTVTLAPGGDAAFAVGFATATGYGSEQCPRSSTVAITPPNDYHSIVMHWAIAPYGGTTQHLECGDVTVSPVYAGSGQAPQS